MILNGRIIIACDKQVCGSYYYFNKNDCKWYGHWKSEFAFVNSGIPVTEIMQKVLTKKAIKEGYPKDIFLQAKKQHTHTHKVVGNKKTVVAKKKVPAKNKSSSFVSLF